MAGNRRLDALVAQYVMDYRRTQQFGEGGY